MTQVVRQGASALKARTDESLVKGDGQVSNTVRHVIGLLVGLAALPTVYYGFAIGSQLLLRRYGDMPVSSDAAVRHTLILVGVAVLVAVLVGWQWLSPLAPLLSGAGLSVVGAFWMIDLDAASESVSADLSSPAYPGVSGVYLFLGIAVLLTSLSPTRWRVRRGSPDAPH